MDAGKIIFEELNKWVYNETNEAGEKLHVIDASDLHEIIPEIVKKLNIQPVIKSVCFGCKRALTIRNEDDVKCLECINGDEKQTVL